MSATKAIENIESSAVDQIAAQLNQVVAESYGLLGQLHLAHWNVEGTDFLPLHEMFQAQYEELFVAIDEVAERVRALGKYAEGGVKKLAEMSTVNEAPSASSASAKDFVSATLVAHEVVIEACVKGRKLAASAGDAETEDLLIGRVKTHQKAVWFLNSYLK
ncbi:DNA starvation/stationary phase protection protein [bacterium]|jgi:starvation-inducible DNA-binding protein|nr:DNA starvation/stationary phase protection protein [bacterium]